MPINAEHRAHKIKHSCVAGQGLKATTARMFKVNKLQRRLYGIYWLKNKDGLDATLMNNHFSLYLWLAVIQTFIFLYNMLYIKFIFLSSCGTSYKHTCIKSNGVHGNSAMATSRFPIKYLFNRIHHSRNCQKYLCKNGATSTRMDRSERELS